MFPSHGKFKLDVSHPITIKKYIQKELDVDLPNLHQGKVGTNQLQTQVTTRTITQKKQQEGEQGGNDDNEEDDHDIMPMTRATTQNNNIHKQQQQYCHHPGIHGN